MPDALRPARKYRDDVLATVTSVLADRPSASPRGMFGHPGFAAGGKMFACLYEDGVAVKLPEAMVQQALTRPGVEPFRPYGKSMREWVLIEHAELAAYADDLDLFDAAIAYVSGSGSAAPATRGTRRKPATSRPSR